MTSEKRLFSSGELEKTRRKGISEAIEILQEKYPEVIGLSLFGSLTKGKGRASSDIASDIDGYVYLDVDAIVKKEGTEADRLVSYADHNKGKFLAGKVYNPVLAKNLSEKYETEIRQELLRNNKNLTFDQVKHVWVFPINGGIINFLVDGYVAGKYEAGDRLRGLFHMRVGQGMNVYRKLMVDKLESLGQRGEEAWRRLIYTVALFEQDTRIPETEIRIEQRHYPQTLEAAKRVYG